MLSPRRILPPALVLISWVAALFTAGLLHARSTDRESDRSVDATNVRVLEMVRAQENLADADKRGELCELSRKVRERMVELLSVPTKSELANVWGRGSHEGLIAAFLKKDRSSALQNVYAARGVVRSVGDHSYTTLHMAASFGTSAKVMKILAARHGTHFRDHWGWTALHVAAAKSALGAALGYLSVAPASDVFALTSEGASALQTAMSSPGDYVREIELAIATATEHHLHAATRSLENGTLAGVVDFFAFVPPVADVAFISAFPSVAELSDAGARAAVRSLLLLPRYESYRPPESWGDPPA
eukprot:gene20452-31487_t